MKNTIPLQPAQSSQIHGTGYDPASKTLAVQFKRKDGSPGSTYLYGNVTPEDHQAFASAESLGKHLGATFKADPERFPCVECVDDEDAEQQT